MPPTPVDTVGASVPTTPRSLSGSTTPRPLSGTAADAARSRWGSGPFKPSQSNLKALFSIKQTEADIKSALRKLDDEFDDHELDGTTLSLSRERAILGGVKVLVEAAEDACSKALKNKKQLGDTAPSGSTMQHQDPRLLLANQLGRTAELSKQCLHTLLGQQQKLTNHSAALQHRLADLHQVYLSPYLAISPPICPSRPPPVHNFP